MYGRVYTGKETEILVKNPICPTRNRNEWEGEKSRKTRNQKRENDRYRKKRVGGPLGQAKRKKALASTLPRQKVPQK